MLCAKYDYKMDIAVKQEEAYEDGLNAGMKSGIEKGAHEKAVESAKNLLNEKIPIETIARCVELPLDEVQKFASELE